MKKWGFFILLLALTVTFVSCLSENGTNVSEETVSGSITELEEVEKEPFSDFDAVLDAVDFSDYDDILNAITLLHAANGDPIFENEPSLDERQSLILDSLPNFICSASGYCITNLDGYGKEELIMLTQDYRLRGVFTMRDGLPVLLGTCTDGGIGTDGEIRMETVEETAEGIRTTYVLKWFSRGSFITVTEFGYTVAHDGNTLIEEYQIINGKRVDGFKYSLDNLLGTYGFRHYEIGTLNAGITCTRLLDIPIITDAEKYFTCGYLENDNYSRTYYYEVYDKNGNTILKEQSENAYLYSEETENGDTIIAIYDNDTLKYYSVEKNRFSEDFDEESVRSMRNGRVVYFKGEGDEKRLVAQDIFDKSRFYKEFDHEICQKVGSVKLSCDGRSIALEYLADGNTSETTDVICLEPLPILKALENTPVYCDSRGFDPVFISSGVIARLRAENGDTVRLMSVDTICGSEYTIDDGSVRNDWYCIDYFGNTYYVMAADFEVIEPDPFDVFLYKLFK